MIVYVRLKVIRYYTGRSNFDKEISFGNPNLLNISTIKVQTIRSLNKDIFGTDSAAVISITAVFIKFMINMSLQENLLMTAQITLMTSQLVNFRFPIITISSYVSVIMGTQLINT